MIISDACIINIINDAFRSVNDATLSAINGSRIMLKLWHHFYNYHDNCNMFIVHATVLCSTGSSGLYYKHIMIINDASSIISKWHSKLWHH
jgi:hypothetical protein